VNDNCSIGVDMGGQSVKLALVDESGVIHLRRQVPMDPTLSADAIALLLIEQVETIVGTARVKGFAPPAVGIVMPGYMDVGRTKLLFAANLPTLNGTDFLSTIKSGIDLPVAFDADCNAAAFGEYHFGAGRGVDRLIVVTVGTGIGGAVMIDGRILRLWNHISGSLGHVIIDARGPRCSCGGRGCVETQASGPAIERLATELAAAEPDSYLAQLLAENGRLTGREIALAVGRGDGPATRVVRDCGWWLGAAVASWSVIYCPEKVLIGGGIAALGEPLLEAVREGLRDVGQPHTTRNVKIGAAALGPDAGMVGAAAMVMPHHMAENGTELE
jgi:glucokinase